MTNVTTILSNESGIQYQGVNDASSSTGTYPVIGLIVGKFLGGRTDKPMTITNANIKTLLGYDPTNPNYVAVQDVLNSGVPSVQVLRIGGDSAFCMKFEWNGTLIPIGGNGESYDELALYLEFYKNLSYTVASSGIKTTISEYEADKLIKEYETDCFNGLYISSREEYRKMDFYLENENDSVVICSTVPFMLREPT